MGEATFRVAGGSLGWQVAGVKRKGAKVKHSNSWCRVTGTGIGNSGVGHSAVGSWHPASGELKAERLIPERLTTVAVT